MSLAVDPVISSAFFTLSLLPHLSRPAAGRVCMEVKPDLPNVSVLLPLYKEQAADIEMTLSSLIDQTYPRNKLEVILIVESEDVETGLHVAKAAKELCTAGVKSKIVLSSGLPKMKPHALNIALADIENEFVCVYDASDSIEANQIEQALSLMLTGNYDVVQAQVNRQGPAVLSKLLWLDTLLWFKKYIPMIAKLASGFPLSGEGLFIRKSALEEVGGFPEMLTEDAHLGLLMTERNKRFALLESAVTEKAPKSVQAHFQQKLRWYRGYLTCLGALIRSKMNVKKKLVFMLLFSTPIIGALAFVSWALLVISWGTHWLVPTLDFTVPWMSHPLYTFVLYYWSLSLTILGPLIAVWSYLSVVPRQRLDVIPLMPLVPLYWIFVSTCAISAFFQDRNHWYKTER